MQQAGPGSDVSTRPGGQRVAPQHSRQQMRSRNPAVTDDEDSATTTSDSDSEYAPASLLGASSAPAAGAATSAPQQAHYQQQAASSGARRLPDYPSFADIAGAHDAALLLRQGESPPLSVTPYTTAPGTAHNSMPLGGFTSNASSLLASTPVGAAGTGALPAVQTANPLFSYNSTSSARGGAGGGGGGGGNTPGGATWASGGGLAAAARADSTLSAAAVAAAARPGLAAAPAMPSMGAYSNSAARQARQAPLPTLERSNSGVTSHSTQSLTAIYGEVRRPLGLRVHVPATIAVANAACCGGTSRLRRACTPGEQNVRQCVAAGGEAARRSRPPARGLERTPRPRAFAARLGNRRAPSGELCLACTAWRLPRTLALQCPRPSRAVSSGCITREPRLTHTRSCLLPPPLPPPARRSMRRRRGRWRTPGRTPAACRSRRTTSQGAAPPQGWWRSESARPSSDTWPPRRCGARAGGRAGGSFRRTHHSAPPAPASAPALPQRDT